MTYTAATPSTATLDLRELAPRERHARVFSRFDALQPGEAMQLLIDHDAQPLRAEFDSRRFAQFEWAVLDAGPSPMARAGHAHRRQGRGGRRAIPAAPAAPAAVEPRRDEPMTFVVTEACIRCKYTDCVDVCPVDAFREGPNFLAIDPDDCIDCAVCVPECPVNAIYAEEDVPADQQAFIALNAELAREWKPITRTKLALPDADEWAKIEAKLGELKR